MLKHFLVLPMLVVFGSQALAQTSNTAPPMPLDQQEQLEAKQRVSRAIGSMADALLQFAELRESQCLKAIGDSGFCKCIAYNSPSEISFVEYVTLVAATKEDMKYDQLSAEDKKLVDAARASRDLCVSKRYPNP